MYKKEDSERRVGGKGRKNRQMNFIKKYRKKVLHTEATVSP